MSLITIIYSTTYIAFRIVSKFMKFMPSTKKISMYYLNYQMCHKLTIIQKDHLLKKRYL